ncbi:conserved hypothetical protein [Actinacidiphila cocklensis]|uniref:Uncharacterized protein n=1 Tax=Actinacidiphila cocklensis TaxID=887465 RepID=A0A9W4DML9_9ACTN|nr:conserved hypothetical protein [Actinacidiphila cocklensis]
MKKDCETCGNSFDAKRRTAKYCSGKCRVQAQRGSTGTTSTVVAFGIVPQLPAEPEPERRAGPLETAAFQELDAVSRAETLAGGVVLALARRIDQAGPDDTGSSFAALTKELRAALAAAVAGAEQDDEIDRARKQMEAKRRGRAG